MEVFVHTVETLDDQKPVNQGREFLRLPVVGEYITLGPTGDWYEVQIVVHCPHTPPSHYAAEVFAVRVDHMDAMKAWRARRSQS